MRIDNTKKKDEKKKKRKQSVLEQEIFSFMTKSLDTALNVALDDILKDWEKDKKVQFKL